MPIYKNKNNNTYYIRTYININGTKKQIQRNGFKSKAKAKIAEEDIIIKSEINTTDNITFIELYNVYLRNKSMILKPQSIRSLKSRFNNHILPFFKDFHIYDININDYLNRKEKIISLNFSYKYNSNLHGALVSIFNFAIDNYNLAKNVAISGGNFSKYNYLPKVDFWTYEEFEKFIEVVDDKIYHCLFSVLFYTGARIGELLALKWYDFKNDYIDINKTIAKCKSNNEYVVTIPKTKSSIRNVKLDLNTLKLLNNLKKYYESFSNYSDDFYIFGGAFPLSHTTISRKKNEYCLKAHVKKIRIHDFRHSHASFLLSNNVPVTVISKRLGHKDINTTMSIYSHFIPSDEDKALIVINKLNFKE